MDVRFELLGLPEEGPTLSLDHERFAYAGKFVVSTTGKAVARERRTSGTEGEVVAATAFSADHAEPGRTRIRYVTVRDDRRGEGIGPRLLRFTAEGLTARGEDVAIAVNNPAAYRACYRAGFVSTGHETGIAELRLRYAPGEARPDRYRAGFRIFEDRTLPDAQRAVIDRHREGEPPPIVPVPSGL